ncbi:hypothetical protein F444_04832 [Phytophthora nicotianae P1976]|uniref:Uncharacterized protein n=1 Tax=Phytophthora nicotianae P1976 TaxID=1317066 RepID=A0A081APB6_PHYNI|nr:hypothetical protein F444_04832 [Phytophthora nicotianae P1976]
MWHAASKGSGDQEIVGIWNGRGLAKSGWNRGASCNLFAFLEAILAMRWLRASCCGCIYAEESLGHGSSLTNASLAAVQASCNAASDAVTQEQSEVCSKLTANAPQRRADGCSRFLRVAFAGIEFFGVASIALERDKNYAVNGCLAGAACASCCLAGAQAAEEDRYRRDYYAYPARRVYVQPVVVKEYYPPPPPPHQEYPYARPVGKA